MSKISNIEWDIVEARVNSVVERHHLSTKSIGLLAIVLEQIFPDIQDRLQEAITDGPDDRGIDAIHIIEGENKAEIYLFQSKYRESYKTCEKTINDPEVLKVSLFLSELFSKSESLRSCNNFKLSEAIHRIWELHERGKICRYHIIFCSNGRGLSTSANRIIDAVCDDNSLITYEFFDGREVVRNMALEGREVEKGSLQVIGKEILERSDGDVRGIICSVDAKSFINLIQTEDGRGVKRHLFDDNLRIFLGSKGGYNSSIIRTATSDDSYLFWYLNNGITITCRNMTYNKGHANPTLHFEDFQIVNGAQTSHSLVEASRTQSEKIDDVVLMVRVYATDRVDIAEQVAVATNSQARIQSRDLRSNHPTLKKLEIAFKQKGYFFERKKNLHSEELFEKRIDALKLGQILMSFDLREPDKAKTDSDSIFDSRFAQIYHDSRNTNDLILLFELYRKIEVLRDKFMSDHGQSPERGHNHRFLIYGHWFILFACRILLTKDGNKDIPKGVAADKLIEKAIDLVADASGQTRAVAHYQIFRSSRTKDKIVAEIGAKQSDFFSLWAK